MMADMRRILVAALMIAVAACSPGAGNAGSSLAVAEDVSVAAVHPVSGLAVQPLTVQVGQGVHRFRVEMARTAEEQAQGLMFRTEMAPDEGMLFPRQEARMASFWMKNTLIPLDIIFIGADQRIINIAANTVPYSTVPVPSDGPALAILELNGGRAAELGIVPGAKVEW
ncbi:DUF192 domain-containing protein [Altererythrobacter xixiisoli]|uniref:DUF192 domain-containing protein n=2 Tax=Croceibacterium xixiisoli TaxID=1476466 RepID=A0A6I4U0E5_9SPHN|nr:DUF192 domain-containing protein [Croceibacterium xixiisoli]